LRNAILMYNKSNKLFASDLKAFFISYDDPIYVRMTKLELLVRLTSKCNINLVLTALKKYAQKLMKIS
jgi:vesicle coat complex subunit